MKRRLKLLALAIGAATALGLLEAIQGYAGSAAAGRPLPFARAVTATMPFWYVLALLAPAVLALARRFPVEPGRWREPLAVHAAGGVAFAVVHLGATSWISDYVLYDGIDLSYVENLGRLFGLYFVIEITYYAVLVGGWHVVAYYRRYREREQAATRLALEASRLEASLARANLDALRMQLNPHFLFNTLNTISVLALKGDGHGVARMLSRLSELLRTALENAAQTVPLRDELEFLERYLEIERVRFSDRLAVEFDVDTAALDAEVPSLIMQPLVENAIGHGIARRPGPGRVTVRARVEGNRLALEVRDTGPGFSAAGAGRGHGGGRGGGVGLANTRARLAQLYGDDHRLELSNAEDGGAVVSIDLPLRAFEAAGAVAGGRAWA